MQILFWQDTEGWWWDETDQDAPPIGPFHNFEDAMEDYMEFRETR